MKHHRWTEAQDDIVRRYAAAEITVLDAAAAIGVSCATVRRRARAKQFPVVRRGGRGRRRGSYMNGSGPSIVPREAEGILGGGPFKDDLRACEGLWRAALAGGRYA